MMNAREMNSGARSEKERTSLVTEARDYIVSAIDGVGDVGKATVDAVSGTLAHSIKGTRSVGAELLGLVVDTITGAVHAVAEVGGEAGGAAKSIMVGGLRGTQQVGQVGAETVSTSAAAVVKGASDVGGSVAEAAKGAVEGAIEVAREGRRRIRVGKTPEAAETGSSTALQQVQNVADADLWASGRAQRTVPAGEPGRRPRAGARLRALAPVARRRGQAQFSVKKPGPRDSLCGVAGPQSAAGCDPSDWAVPCSSAAAC
jgi:hypothetical protein